MARGFRRRGKGADLRYAAKLDEVERGVVIGLMEQVIELLDAPAAPTEAADPFDQIVAGMGGLGIGVSVLPEDQQGWPSAGPVPEDARSFGERDPALQRLLPAGNRSDEQVSAEFRRLTEDGLKQRKAAALRRSIAALSVDSGSVEVDAATAPLLLAALTDVRLVLGERLELRDDTDVERLEVIVDTLAPDDPLVYAMVVYDFLTGLQETLAGELLRSLDSGGQG